MVVTKWTCVAVLALAAWVAEARAAAIGAEFESPVDVPALDVPVFDEADDVRADDVPAEPVPDVPAGSDRSAEFHGNVSAWELVHPQVFDPHLPRHRRQIARDLLERVQLLTAVVPLQDPDQTARLRVDTERLEGLGERASAQRKSRHYLSRAYQHHLLLEILHELTNALECVLRVTDDAAEMACWARASIQLLEQDKVDLALSSLRRARLIPRDDDMPVKAMDPVVWYGEYGRGIVAHILTPYLERQGT